MSVNFFSIKTLSYVFTIRGNYFLVVSFFSSNVKHIHDTIDVRLFRRFDLPSDLINNCPYCRV